ncbi:MAG: putative glycoside hydrolase [Deltaproteobacteria bacterium]|nr:putative glycoside hydrolase [Deltaproteobacteria bacterium]
MRLLPIGFISLLFGIGACRHGDDNLARPSTPLTEKMQEPPRPVVAAPLPDPVADERAAFVAWLKARLPEQAQVIDEPGQPVQVQFTTVKNNTYAQVARSLLNVTSAYEVPDLASAIQRQLHDSRKDIGATMKAGLTFAVPLLLSKPYAEGDAARLGWPADKSLRGLYVRGPNARGPRYLRTLRNMVAHDYNAIVLDLRDYDGLITYDTKVPLAIETKASRGAPIHDLARAIRFAHNFGVRVIARISCFHDETVSKVRPDLVVRNKQGRPHSIGWLDPRNPTAQDYVIALATEAMDAGADEVQLDYVRYPVKGIKNADFGLEGTKITKIDVIRDFVHRVHAVTQPRGVPLSLDIFGMAAQGHRSDVEALGQDPAVLARECEVLSPMVYPSHYDKGFAGFSVPGDHPELVGLGTRRALDLLDKGSTTIVRSWVQAVSWNSPSYSPEYLRQEMESAEANGGIGWLLWQPAQDYSYAWVARPLKTAPKLAAKAVKGSTAMQAER